MAFTISEAFDMLFGQPALAAEIPERNADLAAVSFEGRRWFRRPRAPDIPPQDIEKGRADAKAADQILSDKICARLPAWSDDLRQLQIEQDCGEPGAARPELPLKLDAVRHIPPRLPYDVFAIAAYLVELGGVYHHIQFAKKTTTEDEAAPAGGDQPTMVLRHISITQKDHDIVRAAAKAWAELPPIEGTVVNFARDLTDDKIWSALEPLFESWIVVFGAYAAADTFVRLNARQDRPDPAPLWWKHAWRLLAISDEAAKGTGFQFDVSKTRAAVEGESTRLRWFEVDVWIEFATRGSAETPPQRPSLEWAEFADMTTLSVARQELVSVLPKVRTPAVGCTLRSLSHHLALMPGAGIARGRWTPNYIRPPRAAGGMPDGAMNMLLVPFPYSIEARAFCASVVEDVSAGLADDRVPRFGYFDVCQHWLHDNAARREEIISFLQALIEAARAQAPAIHAVVFPELSLDYDTFAHIRDHIRRTLPEVEILVAGVSTYAGRRGNFVAIASFQRDAAGRSERDYRETVREKHHRWKLERAQLKAYGLLGALSPELSWWENISLQSRRVDFTVIRQSSVLAAMICEDLARVDPCQQVIRAVGPNLVVALLMDAPQINARWPARYATVLAEDPGCAVLTLTSRGLMTRQHRLGTFRSNGDDRVVAMWRDDRNAAPHELKCPYDAQGILLTVLEEESEDITLDGRADKAKAWRYAGDVPVRVPEVRGRFARILGEDDMACWS